MDIHLKSLGCRLNEAELQTWASQFRAQGHRVVAQAEGADVLVLNSCAVTAEASRKSRQQLRRLHRENPNAKLVFTGCDATLSPEQVAAALGVDLVVANRDKDRLVELTAGAFDVGVMPAMATEPGAASLYARGRERAFIKVQDGCRYRCAFCIVSVARGPERSRPIPDIVSEVNALHDGGVQEIVLTGVHVGGYGSDLGVGLADLVRVLLRETEVPRIRFASVEPWDLPEALFALFANNRLMPHMHLPLQSGSDTVLRRMARRGRRETYATLLSEARSRVKDFNVSTDIIVGFPGESEPEWQETLSFVQECGFSHVHVFPYSPRAGTRAASMPDQVPEEIRKSRCRALRQIAEGLKRNVLERHLGRELPVLWEGRGKLQPDGLLRYHGYTANYLRALADVAPGQDLTGRITAYRVLEVASSGDHLLGDPES